MDAISFDRFGSLPSAGTSVSLIDYTFVDDFPYAGSNYYRLIQVDLDGTEKPSNVVHVLFKSGAPIVVPNPMLDNATVYFDELPEDGMILRIMDAGGRIVWSLSLIHI